MTINIQNVIELNASKYNYENNIAITQIKNLNKTNKITYKNLFDKINNVSNHLQKLKIKKQDIIYLNIDDSLNFIITFLGAIKIGIIPIPVNPELNLQQKNKILENSKPALIISDDQNKYNNKQKSKFINSKIWSKKLNIKTISTPNKYYKPKKNTPAFIIYSSGTTGSPKGIVHTHLSIKNTTYLHKKILKLKTDKKILTTSKLFFAYALGNNLFAPLLLGLNTIFNDSTSPLEISTIIKKYKPEAIFSVPTMYRRILNNEKEIIDSFKKVKYFISAGERVPDILYKEWKKNTKTTLLNCYGTSETLAIVIASRPNREKIGSTGKPIDNIKTKLVSQNGTIKKNKGVLHIKHSTFSREYLNNISKNNTYKSGWINTGDLWQIKNYNWYYEGREDDLIKVASKWVNPKEIEKVAYNVKGVLDSFCVSALSKEETNRIALFIYTKNKNHNNIMDKITENIQSLPNYKKPKWIKIINKLPQTSTGKVKRNILKKMIEKN